MKPDTYIMGVPIYVHPVLWPDISRARFMSEIQHDLTHGQS